jgi:hypothetical protein
MRNLYRYEIEYSSYDDHETRVILKKYPIINETKDNFFITHPKMGMGHQKRVSKFAYNTFAYINEEDARANFIRRTQTRLGWFKYWEKECKNALKIIGKKTR